MGKHKKTSAAKVLDKKVGEKIAALRAALRETQEVFALRFDVEQGTISRWEAGSPVARKHRDAVAALAGMTTAEFFHGEDMPQLVPIVAKAAGMRFPISEAAPGSGVSHFKLDLGETGRVSVTIEGNNFMPYYRDGDLIIGSSLSGAEIDKALHRECIVRTVEGDGFICFLYPGSAPGLYNLRSPNPMISDEKDVALEWAAPIKVIVRN